MKLPIDQILKPELLAQIVTTKMPFGKYKDRYVADLPSHYLEWFARKGFPAGELGNLIALTHEIKLNGLEYLLNPLRK